MLVLTFTVFYMTSVSFHVLAWSLLTFESDSMCPTRSLWHHFFSWGLTFLKRTVYPLMYFILFFTRFHRNCFGSNNSSSDRFSCWTWRETASSSCSHIHRCTVLLFYSVLGILSCFDGFALWVRPCFSLLSAYTVAPSFFCTLFVRMLYLVPEMVCFS